MIVTPQTVALARAHQTELLAEAESHRLRAAAAKTTDPIAGALLPLLLDRRVHALLALLLAVAALLLAQPGEAGAWAKWGG